MTKCNYVIREATAEDIEALCGDYQITEALAIDYDNALACVSGVVHEHGYYRLFQNIANNRQYPKCFVFRVSCYVVEYFNKKYQPIICYTGLEGSISSNAACNEIQPKSDKYLRKLGFYPLGTLEGLGVYQLWQN